VRQPIERPTAAFVNRIAIATLRISNAAAPTPDRLDTLRRGLKARPVAGEGSTMPTRTIAAVLAVGLLSLVACQDGREAASVAVLGVDMQWTTQDRCATSSPAFRISNAPAGTASLDFRMTDLDVPSYDHGGGRVAARADGAVPAGAFSYRGPCPPAGAHNYRWAVRALDASGTVLARGEVTRPFPPR
jgi:hypothetical protein